MLVFSALCTHFATAAHANDFLSAAWDRDFLETAIAEARPDFRPPPGVSGITVPHHLLAADLIARGFWAASAGTYDRIIILAPDHFQLVKGRFAVSGHSVPTVFGETHPAIHVAQNLLTYTNLFERHQDLAREHSIAALLPFITRFFPEAEVLPVVAAIHTSPQDWRAAVEALYPFLTDRTLIVQSTDYSHFLPIEQAVLHDQQMLGVISAEDAERVHQLDQPAHLDSKAAQFIQMNLQRKIGARPVILANRNSVQYGTTPDYTTSYIAVAYHPLPARLSRISYDDQTRVFFAGDLLTGRYLLPTLLDPAALADILQQVQELTNGAPIVANLEGIVVADAVTNAPRGSHIMPAGLTLPILRNMNIVALGLANNHIMDFGPSGYAATLSAVRETNIAPLPHGKVVDLGSMRVLALNLLPGADPYVADLSELEPFCREEFRAPLIAFVHWGPEYSDAPGQEEAAFADALAACGFSVVLGAHSHRSDPTVRLAAGQTQWVYSLGNFLFDQRAERSSGQLAELRIFRQGTTALRLVPLPNLFEMGEAARRRD